MTREEVPIKPSAPVLVDRRRARGDGSRGSYRGADRRWPPAPDAPEASPLWATARALSLLAAAVTAALLPLHVGMSRDFGQRLVDVMGDGAAAIGAVAAALLILRWRLGGRTRPAGLAVAVVLLFCLHPALYYSAPLVGVERSPLVWVDLAAVTVALAVLAAVLHTPPVDTRRRPGLLALAAAGGMAGLAVVLQLGLGPTDWPGLGLSTAAQDQVPAVLVGFGAVALALGALLVFRASPPHAVDRWVGTAVGLWGWSKLLTSLHPGRPVTVISGEVLQLLALALLVAGVLEGLVQTTMRQRSALFDNQLSAMVSSTRQRMAGKEQQSRTHDARSILWAVQTATVTLQERLDDLTDDERTVLNGILHSGLRQLDDYVRAAPDEPREVSLSELAQPVIERARRDRIPMAVDVDQTITVEARRSLAAEALGAMFDRVVLSGLPLRLTATTSGGQATLSLGPDPAGLPGVSGPREHSTGEAEGAVTLDLVVLSELLRAEGGRLTLTPAAGGVTLSLDLPLSGASAPGGQTDQAVEGAEGAGQVAGAGGTASHVVGSEDDREIGTAAGREGGGHDGEVVVPARPRPRLGIGRFRRHAVDLDTGAGGQSGDDLGQQGRIEAHDQAEGDAHLFSQFHHRGRAHPHNE